MYTSRKSIRVASICCAIAWAAAWPSCAFTEASPSPREALARAQQEDLEVFRRDFLNVDRSYSAAARAEAEKRAAALEHQAGSVSQTAFAVEICRIVALADNGHSMCFASGASVGLKVAPFIDGLFVTRVNANDADLLGSRLLAVDGTSVGRARRVLRSLAGGTPEHRDLQTASMLSRPDVLHILGIARQADSAVYQLRKPDGRIVERRLTAAAPTSNWADFRPENPAWASAEPGEPFRLRDAPELDAVVVQLRQNMDRRDRKIAVFLEDAERSRERWGRKNVVLDMRWNVGGNFLQTRDFMLAWPDRLPASGRFFVLTGPSTFSAGIASTAYLKQAGGGRVIIVGEPVGDRLTFFAESNRPVRLKNANLVLMAAPQRDDFHTGCRGYDDCLVVLAQPGSRHATPPEKLPELEPYGRRPLEVASLTPDVSAPWTFADYAGGRDPAVLAIQALVKSEAATAARDGLQH